MSRKPQKNKSVTGDSRGFPQGLTPSRRTAGLHQKQGQMGKTPLSSVQFNAGTVSVPSTWAFSILKRDILPSFFIGKQKDLDGFILKKIQF